MKRSISALLFFSSIALAAIDFTPFAKTPASEPASTAGMRISNPKIKAKMGNKMTEGMLMPYKKLLDKVQKKK